MKGICCGYPVGSARTWAVDIYATARLPDGRLNKRLVEVSAALAAKPQDSIPEANGDWAATKGAYRFIENERVTVDELTGPVFESTARKCSGMRRVLAVQDTSSMNFSSLPATTGLGPIDEKENVKGMLLHSAIALREDGVPVGLLSQRTWCRDPDKRGRKHDHRKRPIEDKESRKWLDGAQDVRTAVRENILPNEQPVIIHVFDREGDVHEVFADIIDQPGEEFVIRCTHNRRITGEIKHAHDAVARTEPLGKRTIEIPRTRTQAARTAKVEIRAKKVTLDPDKGKHPGRGRLRLYLVELRELHPPERVEPVHWFLWTTLPVKNIEDAMEIVRIYTHRWRIEQYHYILKSGCGVEKVQFKSADNIRKVLALYGPIAVRILQLTYQARQDPDLPCTVVLDEGEWRALYAYIHKEHPKPEQAVPTLRQAVLWIGRLGGHLGRKGDGMPGVKTLWRGWRDLELLTAMYRTFQALPAP